ncbi:glycosyltransferase [Vibrio atypicus]|uniref:glycosyltransferase n=1 Tax=Vibrio atypicus TaxID=558271 RepID=UPI00157704BE|nr:glycosyltransferase [Vibrio atypicus]
MRVAVVVNCLKIGGMERVAVNLADAFHDAGHKTDLIYLKNRKKEITPKNSDLPVHLFNLKKSVFFTGLGTLWFVACKLLNLILNKTYPLWFAYAESYAFKKQLKKLEAQNGQPFDLVVFRGQGTFEHLWPIQDKRFVYVCENVQKKSMYGRLSGWVFTKLFQNRNVTCVSQGALDSFQDMVETHQITPKKAIVVNNPNDFINIRQQAECIQEELHDKPYILGLGRLVPQKNFSLLVKAYHYAINTYDLEQDLVIVGAGSDQIKIEAEVKRLNLTERVHFKGQQTNPFPWYKAADLYVLSSKHEGLGMVLIESLACGTPVVSTDSRGGVRQIMNGALEPFLAKETPESLGEAINFALHHEWDTSFNGYVQETLDKFDGKKIVEAYIDEFAVKQ